MLKLGRQCVHANFQAKKVVHHLPWLLSVDAERASRIVKNLCDISSTMNA